MTAAGAYALVAEFRDQCREDVVRFSGTPASALAERNAEAFGLVAALVASAIGAALTPRQSEALQMVAASVSEGLPRGRCSTRFLADGEGEALLGAGLLEVAPGAAGMVQLSAAGAAALEESPAPVAGTAEAPDLSWLLTRVIDCKGALVRAGLCPDCAAEVKGELARTGVR